MYIILKGKLSLYKQATHKGQSGSFFSQKDTIKINNDKMAAPALGLVKPKQKVFITEEIINENGEVK